VAARTAAFIETACPSPYRSTPSPGASPAGPLPSGGLARPMRLNFDIAYCATQGARPYQEDTCSFAVIDAKVARLVPEGGVEGEDTICAAVAALADGMGGHVGGARASRLACTHFIETWMGADAPLDRLASFSSRLTAALDAANQAIVETIRAEPQLDGMGSTLIGIVADSDGLRWVSVGDSRLLLYREGELFALNEDHSLAPILDKLVEDGEMTAEEASNHPGRHHLLSALTGHDIELIDLFAEPFPLAPDDLIVLASDGIDTLDPDELSSIINQHKDCDSAEIAASLVGALEALDAPQQDNATILVVKVRSG